MGENLSSLTAKNLGLEKSLLERLFEYYPFDLPCKLKLLENFRSYSEIVQLTSHLFYDDSLICNKTRNGKLRYHDNLWQEFNLTGLVLSFCFNLGQRSDHPSN